MKDSTVHVCAACCKVGKSRGSVGDESCYMHSVECWADSFAIRNGRLFAVPTNNDWVPYPPRFKSPSEIMQMHRNARGNGP